MPVHVSWWKEQSQLRVDCSECGFTGEVVVMQKAALLHMSHFDVLVERHRIQFPDHNLHVSLRPHGTFVARNRDLEISERRVADLLGEALNIPVAQAS